MAAQAPVAKTIVVGESGVGKTSLIFQYVEGTFSTHFRHTIGRDFFAKSVPVESDGGSIAEVVLHLWDSAGQGQYRCLTTGYFRGCEAAVIVFDLTDATSYVRIHDWFKNVLELCNLGVEDMSGEGRLPVFIVGNKTDLTDDYHYHQQQWKNKRRVVIAREAEELCAANGWEYAECSAKSGEGVAQVFERVTAKVFARMRKQQRLPAEEDAAHKNAHNRRADDRSAAQKQAPTNTRPPCCATL
jgi:small GTP-binding protein